MITQAGSLWLIYYYLFEVSRIDLSLGPKLKMATFEELQDLGEPLLCLPMCGLRIQYMGSIQC